MVIGGGEVVGWGGWRWRRRVCGYGRGDGAETKEEVVVGVDEERGEEEATGMQVW